MASTSLRSGACPSCGGTDIYTTRGTSKRGERMQLAVSGFASISLDTYVCLGCGHFEEVVPKDELASTAAKIQSTWTNV